MVDKCDEDMSKRHLNVKKRDSYVDDEPEGDSKSLFFRKSSKSSKDFDRLSKHGSTSSLNLIGSGNLRQSMLNLCHSIQSKITEKNHKGPAAPVDVSHLPPKASKRPSKLEDFDTLSLSSEKSKNSFSISKSDNLRQSFMNKFGLSGKDKSKKHKNDSKNPINPTTNELVVSSTRFSLSEFDIRDDKQPRLQLSTSTTASSPKSPNVVNPALSPTFTREISYPKAVDNEKMQEYTNEKQSTIQKMIKGASDDYQAMKIECDKKPTEMNLKNLEVQEKIIKRLKSQLSQTTASIPETPVLPTLSTPGSSSGKGNDRRSSCIENSYSSLEDKEDSSSSSCGLPLHAYHHMPRNFKLNSKLKGALISNSLSRSHSDSYKQRHHYLESLKLSVSSDDFRAITENAAICKRHQNAVLSRSHSKSQGGTSDGNSETDQLHPLAEEHSASSLDISNSTTSITRHLNSQQFVGGIMAFDEAEVSDGEKNELHSAESQFLKFDEIRKKPAHLAVFLHYLISNADPAPLLFYLVTEAYHQGSNKDMKRWAYEIFTTFLYERAPLKLVVDPSSLEVIYEVFSNKSDKEERLSSLFEPARCNALATVMELLGDFRGKLSIGLGSFYGEHELRNCNDHASETSIIERYLWRQFVTLSSEENDRSSTMCSALLTFFRTVGFAPANSFIEKFPPFVYKEKAKFSVFSKSTKKGTAQTADHHLQQQQYTSITYCNLCQLLIGGVGFQGYVCQRCDQNFHKSCINNIKDKCTSKKVDRSKTTPNILRKKISVKGSSKMHEADQDSNLPRTVSLISLRDNNRPHKYFWDRDRDPSKDTSIVPNSTLSRDDSLKLGFEHTSSLLAAAAVVGGKLTQQETTRGKSPEPDDEMNEFIDPINKLFSNYHIPALANNSQQEIACDSDLDVEMEVPQLESYIPKECLKKMKPKEKKRQNIINELFHTEKNHVRNMKVMYNVIYLKMHNEYQKDFVNLLFPNLDELIKVHDELNKEFKKKMRNSNNFVVENVTDILIRHFTGEKGKRFKRVCAMFCEKQPHALEKLKTRQKKDQKLSAFLQEAASNPQCKRFELKDLLPTAMQRLTKYPLFISSLLKYTTDTEECLKLQTALEGSRSILEHVDKAVLRHSNHLKLVDMQRRLDKKAIENVTSSILAEYRNLDLTRHMLVFDGPLTWRISRDRLIPLHVVLLEDILLLLQKQDDRLVLKCQSMYIAAGKIDTRLTHSPIIKLVNLLIKPVATDPSAFFLVSQLIDPGPQIYDLVASSKEDKDRWCKRITEALDAYKIANPEAWKSNQLQHTSKPRNYLRSGPISPTEDTRISPSSFVQGVANVIPESIEEDLASQSTSDLNNRFTFPYETQSSNTTITEIPHDDEDDYHITRNLGDYDSNQYSRPKLIERLKEIDEVVQDIIDEKGRLTGHLDSQQQLPPKGVEGHVEDVTQQDTPNTQFIVNSLLNELDGILEVLDKLTLEESLRSDLGMSRSDTQQSNLEDYSSQSHSLLPLINQSEYTDSCPAQSESRLISSSSDSSIVKFAPPQMESIRDSELENSGTGLQSNGSACATFREYKMVPPDSQVSLENVKDEDVISKEIFDKDQIIDVCLILQMQLRNFLKTILNNEEVKETEETASEDASSSQDIQVNDPVISEAGEECPDENDKHDIVYLSVQQPTEVKDGTKTISMTPEELTTDCNTTVAEGDKSDGGESANNDDNQLHALTPAND